MCIFKILENIDPVKYRQYFEVEFQKKPHINDEYIFEDVFTLRVFVELLFSTEPKPY